MPPFSKRVYAIINTRMIDQDLNYDIRHFGIEPKRKQIQVPNRTIAPTPATPMASSAPLALNVPIVPTAPVATMDDSDSSDEGSLFVSDSSSIIDESNNSPHRKSSNLSITSASSNEEDPQPWKHPRSSVQRSETLERTRVIESEEPERMDIDDVVLNDAVRNDMINPNWDYPVNLQFQYLPQFTLIIAGAVCSSTNVSRPSRFFKQY
jgi:hypothetical protein